MTNKPIFKEQMLKMLRERYPNLYEVIDYIEGIDKSNYDGITFKTHMGDTFVFTPNPDLKNMCKDCLHTNVCAYKKDTIYHCKDYMRGEEADNDT